MHGLSYQINTQRPNEADGADPECDTITTAGRRLRVADRLNAEVCWRNTTHTQTHAHSDCRILHQECVCKQDAAAAVTDKPRDALYHIANVV